MVYNRVALCKCPEELTCTCGIGDETLDLTTIVSDEEITNYCVCERRRGCCEKFLIGTHMCSIINTQARCLLMASVLLFFFDVLIDILFTAVEFSKGHTGLGIVMVILIILPNMWGNYLAIKAYPQNSYSCFRRWLLPYPFRSCKFIFYNMLSLLQMRPLVMVVELLTHKLDIVRKLVSKVLDYARVRYIVTLSENIPHIAIQLLILMEYLVVDKKPLSEFDVFRMIAIVIKVFSLCFSILSYQQKKRTASKTSYDMKDTVKPPNRFAGKSALLSKISRHLTINLQSVVQGGIYLLMIVSRLISIGLLHSLVKHIKIGGYSSILPLMILEVHHGICFLFSILLKKFETFCPPSIPKLVNTYIKNTSNILYNKLPAEAAKAQNFIATYSINLFEHFLVGAFTIVNEMVFPHTSACDASTISTDATTTDTSDAFTDCTNSSTNSTTVTVHKEDLPKTVLHTLTLIAHVLYSLAGLFTVLYISNIRPKKQVKHEWKETDDDILCDYGVCMYCHCHILRGTKDRTD